jgi:hypothetical protein
LSRTGRAASPLTAARSGKATGGSAAGPLETRAEIKTRHAPPRREARDQDRGVAQIICSARTWFRPDPPLARLPPPGTAGQKSGSPSTCGAQPRPAGGGVDQCADLAIADRPQVEIAHAPASRRASRRRPDTPSSRPPGRAFTSGPTITPPPPSSAAAWKA